jgi:hypothetical protein
MLAMLRGATKKPLRDCDFTPSWPDTADSRLLTASQGSTFFLSIVSNDSSDYGTNPSIFGYRKNYETPSISKLCNIFPFLK